MRIATARMDSAAADAAHEERRRAAHERAKPTKQSSRSTPTLCAANVRWWACTYGSDIDRAFASAARESKREATGTAEPTAIASTAAAGNTNAAVDRYADLFAAIRENRCADVEAFVQREPHAVFTKVRR